MVTGTLVPRTPELGLTEVSVGAGGLTTVNVTLFVIPMSVVTLTFLAERVAPVEIAKVAVTVVSFTTVTLLTVIPLPETLTAVAPVRPAPARVTGTL
jgi:hypothetical protein